MSDSRPAAQVSADFDAAVTGSADIDVYDVLVEIVEDVLDSVRQGFTAGDLEQAIQTARDYFANHYLG